MSRITSEKNTAEYDATDRSGVEILADGACNRNLLTIVGIGGDFTAGTVEVYVKGRGSRRYLAMKDAYGNAVSINLATADAVMIDKPIGSVMLNVSGISGATGWKAVLSGIDEPMSVNSSSVPGPVMTTEQDSAVFTATATSASVLFTADMTNWRSVLLQVTSAGSSCTVSYECSNDQSVWYPVMGNYTNYNVTSTLGAITTNATTAAVQIQFPKRAKYFRARVSVYGSGTVSVAYALSTEDAPSAPAATVWGQVAEGSALGGNPVTIGIECRTATKTAVSSGQVVRPIGTTDGRLVVRPHSVPELEWAYAPPSGGLVNSTAAVVVKAAAGANVRNYITSVQVMAEALTNATELTIENGDGTVLWRTKITTAGLPTAPIRFDDPIKGTANASLQIRTVTASGTGAVYVNAQGYYAP